MLNIDYLSAFVIGLLGSAHCIGMCGGISAMLTSALGKNSSTNGRIKLIISYHLGRISSYAFIGAIAGLTSSIAIRNIGIPLEFLRLLSAAFLILLGLYLGQWLMWLNRIESLGRFLWQFLSPLSKKFIPVNSARQALALGAVWGWLPCGLVYSTLTWSLASENVFSGAIIMICFGLGTMPALFSISVGAFGIKSLLSDLRFRRSMAIIIILYGLAIAYRQVF